jgi:sugar phosphate isomerase/epimerase
MELLEHCADIGAGGLQTGIGNWTTEFAKRIRARADALGLYLEGQVGLPKTAADVGKFEQAAHAATEAGIGILRAVCLGGRRYETFARAADWEKFTAQSQASLELAEPVVRRHGLRLAIENHKDWRVDEQIDLLRRLGSERVGVTLDCGNNLALLEDPMDVVRRLAPVTFTIHFKDMALAPSADGFLLSEVPLGRGVLDLREIVAVCTRANPKVQFNLEMITRDPLSVPCLGEKYWATFQRDQVRAIELARALALAKQRDAADPLPRTTGLPADDVLNLEEQNILQCFAYARANLGL